MTDETKVFLNSDQMNDIILAIADIAKAIREVNE